MAGGELSDAGDTVGGAVSLIVNVAAVSDGDDNNLQFAVVDFVNDAVIADADSPRFSAFEFLYVRRPRVGFKVG